MLGLSNAGQAGPDRCSWEKLLACPFPCQKSTFVGGTCEGQSLRRAGVKAFGVGGLLPASKSRAVSWPVRRGYRGGRPAFLGKVDRTAYVLLLFGRREMLGPVTFSGSVAPAARPPALEAPRWGIPTRGRPGRTHFASKSYSGARAPAPGAGPRATRKKSKCDFDTRRRFTFRRRLCGMKVAVGGVDNCPGGPRGRAPDG